MAAYAASRPWAGPVRLNDIGLCLLCVGLGSAGQVLLRASSIAAARSAVQGWMGWLSWTAVAAVVLYAAGMILWLWVLTRVPITQAFAFFGLSFVIVPLAARYWLDDPLPAHALAGGVVIMLGIALSSWPSGS